MRLPVSAAGPWAVLLLLAACGVARAQLGAVRTVFDFPGQAPLEDLGRAIAPLGDLNGDGRADFAIGAPGWGPAGSDSTGRVLVFFGGRRRDWSPDLVLTGAGRGVRFGHDIATLGDVNHDGFDDFCVSAPGEPIPGRVVGATGRAYFYLGSASPDATPDYSLDPPPTSSLGSFAWFFGKRVARAGDVNGDGWPDWCIAYERTSSSANGGFAVYLGGPRWPVGPIQTIAVSPPIQAMCGFGDQNGDGFDDFAVGCPAAGNLQAAVRVYLGDPASGLSPFPRNSTSLDTAHGAALAPMGDLDGDGDDELAIGIPRAGGGDVHVWYGGPTFPDVRPLFFSSPSPRPDSFGISLSVGDALGNGRPSLLVGASGDDTGGPASGRVHLYDVAFAPAPTWIRAVAGSPGTLFGDRVTFVGDVDANGEDDFVAVAPFASAGGFRSGAVRLMTVSPHTLLSPDGPEELIAGQAGQVSWLGELPPRLSLSLDGGANWTTLAELPAGSRENHHSFPVPDTVTARARVRISLAGSLGDRSTSDQSTWGVSIVREREVLSGVVRERDRQPAPAGAGRFGAALTGGRDFDGDGWPDVVVGSPLADASGPNSGTATLQFGGGTRSPLVIAGLHGGERFGSRVELGGDADGDGIADLLVSAPGAVSAGGATGRVDLFRGGPGGGRFELVGPVAGEGFATAIAWIRRFDGTGFDDFAIAAPEFVPPAGSLDGGGRVLVFLGTNPLPLSPALELRAPSGFVRFGRAMASLDLNGDGFGDLAVSALSRESGLGEVFVYFGRAVPGTAPDLRLVGDELADEFAEVLANAGDVNGDGVEDLAAGSPRALGQRGVVDLFTGGDPPAPTAARRFEGLVPGEEFGSAIAGAGDLNGDGFGDLVAGAPAAGAGAGAIRVLLGRSTRPFDGEWTGRETNERLGAALAPAGDFDDDRLREFVAGAPLETYPGRGETGSVTRFDLARYAIESPRAGASWFAGGTYEIAWRGGEPAEVSLSVDGGRRFEVLVPDAGPGSAHAIPLQAPSEATDSAWVRVRAVREELPLSEYFAGPIAIGRAVKVAHFDYELRDDGIRLSWETEPAVGEQGLAAYRVDRVAPGGGDAEPVSGGPITAGELLVAEFTRGATYVLVGIDGNGADQELARVMVPAPATAFRVWPVPSGEFADVQLSIFPPVDGSGRTAADFTVTVYDVNGRAVKRVAGGGIATRVGEVRASWDGRDREGARLGAGVYFVRAESASRGFRMDRRIVVLR